MEKYFTQTENITQYNKSTDSKLYSITTTVNSLYALHYTKHTSFRASQERFNEIQTHTIVSAASKHCQTIAASRGIVATVRLICHASEII